jgi:hypothetical protein
MSSLPSRPATKAPPSASVPNGSTDSAASSLPNQPCRHPRVQIVAREEDADFVECLECREIFEASEFKDMAIEEQFPQES